MKRIGFILTLLLLYLQPGWAQSNASISGSVKDELGATLSGVTIKALNLASGRELTTVTNEAGHYELSEMSAGQYRISAVHEGFATGAVSLLLTQPTTQDFTLVPGAIAENITITAGKGSGRLAEETPQVVSILTNENLERQRPATLIEALERTPNLEQGATSPQKARPRLRGLVSNRVLMVVDGERLNNTRSDPSINGGEFATVVDTSQLESIEVLSSAGSSLYGSDATAGVINLITKTPVRPDSGQLLNFRLDGDAQANGWYRRGGLAVNYSTPHFAIRLSGSSFRTSDYHAGGGQDITIADMLRRGQFASDVGNFVNVNILRTYPVYNFPSQGVIPGGNAHGFNDQVDVWFYPSTNHSLRYRQLNTQHYNIGQAFSTPPYLAGNSFNDFRRLDKNGLRYEGREFAAWLPRVAAGFYRQKFSFPQNSYSYTLNPNSSYRTFAPDPTKPTVTVTELTGNPSTYTLTNYTSNKSSVTSWGFDGQVTLVPFSKLLLTSGASYMRDESTDEFFRYDFTPTTLVPRNYIFGASSPNTRYRNLAGFGLAEFEPFKWLRLTGGLRVDDWNTAGLVTKGFPLGTESYVVAQAVAAVQANPGPVSAATLQTVADLAAGKAPVSTQHRVVNGNAGIVLRLPWGINPFFRWGSSFREPSVTERYLLRNFGAANFSVLSLPSLDLKPEKGNTYDVGVKMRQNRWQGAVGYFRNNLTDFIRSQSSQNYFVPANPALGVLPFQTGGTTHGVVLNLNYNAAAVRIQGVEAQYEYSLSLGRAGSLNPFGSMGWLKGSDLSPTTTQLNVINKYYNRSDTPIKLSGSATDVPLGAITPFRGVFGVRYTDARGGLFAEYQARHQSLVTRIDPVSISSTNTTNYSAYRNIEAFTRHSVRMGYDWRRENSRLLFTWGVDNLTNRFYYEHFLGAPAPGLSIITGLTLEFNNLLRR